MLMLCIGEKLYLLIFSDFSSIILDAQKYLLEFCSNLCWHSLPGPIYQLSPNYTNASGTLMYNFNNFAGSGLMNDYWMKPLTLFKASWKRNVINTLKELKLWPSR